VTIHELLHTDKFGGRSWPGEVGSKAGICQHRGGLPASTEAE
jgi:hypothetical protein